MNIKFLEPTRKTRRKFNRYNIPLDETKLLQPVTIFANFGCFESTIFRYITESVTVTVTPMSSTLSYTIGFTYCWRLICLISLHIRSMWETICDAQAGFCVNSKFLSKFSRAPVSGISDQSTPPPPHENWNLGRSWHFEYLQFWLPEFPPPLWKLKFRQILALWVFSVLTSRVPPTSPSENWNLGRSWHFEYFQLWLQSTHPPPRPKIEISYVETNFCIPRGYHLVLNVKQILVSTYCAFIRTVTRSS